MTRVRFAPSPTGKLHLGNAYVAVLNWLFARAQGGTFMLRLDDTDAERSRAALAGQIKVDLAWLGLDWQHYAVQSERLGRYAAAREALIGAGRLYPCYETPEELDLKRKVQQLRGQPPVYDRAALSQTDAQRRAFEAEGRLPHWRFKLVQDAEVSWDDAVRGPQTIKAETQSDPVLIRADGRVLYTLSSCVDDLEMDITHILRGGDHVSNTVAQIQLLECLLALGFGHALPTFGHLPLIYDKDGGKLSKRFESLSLEGLRTGGDIEPQAVVAYLASLGTAILREPTLDIADLAADFDLTAFNAGAPRLDMADLATLTAKFVRKLPYAAVADRAGVDEATWNLVSANLSSVAQAKDWLPILDGEIAPLIEEPEYIVEALAAFPDGAVTQDSWAAWTSTLSERTGRKGQALFLPLRKALTGQSQGPGMAAVLLRLGRNRARKRLGG